MTDQESAFADGTAGHSPGGGREAGFATHLPDAPVVLAALGLPTPALGGLMVFASESELGLGIIKGLEFPPPQLGGPEISRESGLISLATNTTWIKISLS